MPGRSIVRAFVTLALTVLGLLLLLEASARVLLFGPAGLDPVRVDSAQPIWETGLLRTSAHRELGWEFKPNADGYFKLARLRTNSRGLRDREYALEKPPGTFRVAILGASFALPSGVEIEEAFHSVLEKRLNGAARAPAYEFINFAVGAYGPRQVLAMLRLRASAYEPDLVLFEVSKLSMPLLRDAWDRPLPPPIDLSRRHAFHRSFLAELLKVRLGKASVAIEEGRLRSRSRRGATIVEKLGEFARANGIPVVVVRLELEPDPPSATDVLMEKEIRAEGLFFVDTRAAFAGARARDYWIYELDPHPNARAHAIFADVIATFLRENGLIER